MGGRRTGARAVREAADVPEAAVTVAHAHEQAEERFQDIDVSLIGMVGHDGFGWIWIQMKPS